MSIEVGHESNTVVSRVSNTADMRFRCPHCQKLYETSRDVFDSSRENTQAEFDCVGCKKSFYLKKEQDEFGLYIATEIGAKTFATCPKCSNLKPHNSDECPTCGVFATKYIESQKSESPALFELNQQWQKVMLNFDQDQYHQDFINKCHLKLALNFAFQKYSNLQKNIGFDSLCEKYIRQIELRLEQQFKILEGTATADKIASNRELSLLQYFFFGIGSVGMLMLIYNKFIPTFPNFNGLVMIFTIFSFAIGLFSDNQYDATASQRSDTKSDLKF